MTMPSDESHTEVGPCHMLLGSQGRRTDKGTQQVPQRNGQEDQLLSDGRTMSQLCGPGLGTPDLMYL